MSTLQTEVSHVAASDLEPHAPIGLQSWPQFGQAPRESTAQSAHVRVSSAQCRTQTRPHRGPHPAWVTYQSTPAAKLFNDANSPGQHKAVGQGALQAQVSTNALASLKDRSNNQPTRCPQCPCPAVCLQCSESEKCETQPPITVDTRAPHKPQGSGLAPRVSHAKNQPLLLQQ